MTKTGIKVTFCVLVGLLVGIGVTTISDDLGFEQYEGIVATMVGLLLGFVLGSMFKGKKGRAAE